MALSLKAIDRLFDRLAATYGQEFKRKFDGVDMNAVKSAWAHELGGFERDLQPIAWALENPPEKAPNVIEFRNLARKAPAPEMKAIEAPKADPARVAAELARLGAVRASGGLAGDDGKAWARRLMARHDAGEMLRPISLRFAREALGIRHA